MGTKADESKTCDPGAGTKAARPSPRTRTVRERAETLMRYRSARRAFGSDAEMAETFEVHRSQITRWKQGSPPDSENAERLVGLDVGRVTARRLPGRREHPQVAARDQRASRQSQADGRGPRGTAVGGNPGNRGREVGRLFVGWPLRAALRLWRIFPWDRVAAEGAPFGASDVTPRQVSGRFDLGGAPPVLYLGESAVHAIGEKIQRYRGQTLEPADLREFGKPLSLVEATVVAPPASIVDLCDPAELVRFGCRPDQLMSRDVLRTQSIARKLYEGGLGGFRVWSALTGDWHSTVIFLGAVKPAGSITYGNPTELTLTARHFLKPRASWRSP